MSNFEFSFVPRGNQARCAEVAAFIERHEWLGKMPARPTHRFVATYWGQIAGVVVMATPNSFSCLLGKENRDLEKLISRGACISWSPKNLASALIMFSIRWMVRNTSFRFFTAYSDPEARELGTIYQACNFTYLGQESGARAEYFDPSEPEKGWFSDRRFRKTSQVKRYANELGIDWQPHWSARDKVHWNNIPIGVLSKLKDRARQQKDRCEVRDLSPKHKYVYILGQSKRETANLRELFRTRNPSISNLSYPKMRGPIAAAANSIIKKEFCLTRNSQNHRPHGREASHAFITVKEVSEIMRVSMWTIYHLIKTDPSFPCLNVGIKKKFVVSAGGLEAWMRSRSQTLIFQQQNIPTAEDLLKTKGDNPNE